MSSNTTFSGFPAAGLQFMRDLSANNTKEWFEANKKTYLDAVQAPAVALVTTLGERLGAKFPEIGYDTRINGSGSLLRIYRDTRFSADKSPYKTNIAMMFTSGVGKKMEIPGFGLQITLDQVESVAGIFGFPKPVLTAFREAVLHDKHGAALDAAAAQVRAAGNYTIGEQEYKRVPSGFDADHPRAEWLKYTGLTAYAPPLGLDLAQTPELVDVLMGHFEKMSPIYHWLTQTLAW